MDQPLDINATYVLKMSSSSINLSDYTLVTVDLTVYKGTYYQHHNHLIHLILILKQRRSVGPGGKVFLSSEKEFGVLIHVCSTRMICYIY